MLVLPAETGSGLVSPLTANLDFAGFQALNVVLHSGATLPTSPSNGQLFNHVTTGRDFILKYNSSLGYWVPIYSDPATPIVFYVDSTGTDTYDDTQGTATGTSAFKTLQYAVDQIPAGGTATVYCDADSFTAGVLIQGKAAVTFTGTLPSASTTGTSRGAGTAISMGAAGAGMIQATLLTSLSLSANQYDNFLLVTTGGTGSGQERIIDGHTATGTNDTLRIVGDWTTLPDATTTFAIYDMSAMTTIDLSGTSDSSYGIETNGQKNVTFKYFNIEDAHGVYFAYMHDFSNVTFQSCRFYTSRVDRTGTALARYESYSSGNVNSCLFHEGAGTSMDVGLDLFLSTYSEQDNNMQNCKFIGCATQIRVAGISFSNYSSQGQGLVLRSGRTRGVFISTSSSLDLGETLITGVTSQDGILVQDNSILTLRDSIEISSCGRDGVRALTEAIINAFGSAGTSMQINSNTANGGTGSTNSTGRLVNTRISYSANGVNSYVDDGTGLAT